VETHVCCGGTQRAAPWRQRLLQSRLGQCMADRLIKTACDMLWSGSPMQQ